MVLNDLLGLLMEVPPVLASQWAAWFAVGLILSIWGRREKGKLVVHGSRHASGIRHVAVATARSNSGVRPPAVARAAHAPAASSSGDAFAELEALLEQPAGLHRTPGDAAQTEAETPLSAPQSLP